VCASTNNQRVLLGASVLSSWGTRVALKLPSGAPRAGHGPAREPPEGDLSATPVLPELMYLNRGIQKVPPKE
jgi:hypothetical protein